LDYTYDAMILLLGVTVGGALLIAALAVGPYGRRGLRLALATTSLAAFVASAYGALAYYNALEQRRAIEARLIELRSQALAGGSALACLERIGDVVDAACAQTLFAAPETLAAATIYTAARLDLLAAAARYAGPRTPQFDDGVAALRRSLQQDPFALVANSLVVREGCTATRCDRLALFDQPGRIRDNIREKAFAAHVARYAAGWRTPAATAGPAAASTAIAPTGGETRAPIPDKYTLPSAASIPPVSIMNDEPERRAAPRPAATEQPAPPAQKQAPPRRETSRPSAPLLLNPAQ
jgi:hypothetical protein